MEGHAGAGRLNSAADDSAESEAGADQTSTEVTAGEVDRPPDTGAGDSAAAEPESVVPGRGPSRLGRGWVTGICAAVVLLAAGAAAGGYCALRSHQESQAIAGDNAAAVAAAKDCLAATQAPDTAALPDAQQKIVECSTGDFGAQAQLYSSMLAQAYQAADIHLQVSEMRAAVERDNDDGSIDLLMAMRVKVDNIGAQGQEVGYRLRVKMAREEGQYKIANLDQVAK
jgi:Mce-associated membrane protein